MWPPQNIHALPSKDEIQQIKEEIPSMELQIVEAQLKIEALQKSVAERKAWIAPIRKLPHEVLSQIFTEVSMEHWRAPLSLQSVCRWWRDVLVGSPRAWTLIPLSKCHNAGLSEVVSLFIERSRDTTLHMYASDHRFLPQMKMLAHRIECMSIFMTVNSRTNFIPGEYNFTRLERLTLRANFWHSDSNPIFNTSQWDMMHFPNLKVLDLDVWDPLLLAIATSPQFPLIQHLTVVCGDPSPLTDILVKCANSLESINLICTGIVTSSRLPNAAQSIHLPFLRYIRLQDNTADRRSHWYLNGSTPNLEAYLDDGKWPIIDTFKFDTSNVIFLHVRKAPDLSRFPRLVTLRIVQGDQNLMKIINCLQKRPQYSPELVVIECGANISDIGLEKAKAALLAHTEETARRVRLERIDWEKDVERETRCGLVPCSRYMPCNGNIDLSN